MQCPTCDLLQKAPVGCQGRLQLRVHNQVLSCSQVKDRPTCPSDAASPTLTPKNELGISLLSAAPLTAEALDNAVHG